VRGVQGTGGGARVLAVDRTRGAEIVAGADVVVGADGLHSAVLAQLHPGRVQLRGAGAGMWRGASDLAGFLDGGTMILANDDRGARLIAYPISARHAARGRALVNWVCLVPAGAPGPLRGEAGWNRPARLEEVQPHYEHWAFGWLRVADLLAAAAGIFYYPMADRDPLPSWGRDRVTLLGNAAHLMYPVGANGASQAILYASVLAGTLSAASGIPAALRRYEAIRRPATTRLVQASRDMGRAERAAVTSPGPDQGATLAAIARDYGQAVAASIRPAFPPEPR
jgi:5-methylphenazine-1-carboxylate 1-monooxygenase